MNQYSYDVVVIGSGTAGETAAGILNEAGRRVAVVERGPVGGTCALRGCQPKKYLVVNTHLVGQTRALQGRGIVERARTDWPALQRFKRSFTDAVPERTTRSLEERGIDLHIGKATFTAPGTLTLGESGPRLCAPHMLIATGARSRELRIPGAELAATSDDYLDLERLPDSMIFIGGGYISLEFAFVAALAGSRITVLQRGPRMLPQFPAALVDPVLKAGEELGIHFRTDATVEGISRSGDAYTVATAEHGSLTAAWVMGAIGRAPNTEDLGLEAVGVKASPGGIEVNEYLETSANGVYAAGDCVATKQLSPISDMEAAVAAANILSPRSRTVDGHPTPSVVFTHPQMASVGLTGEQARSEGLSVKVRSGRGDSWPNYRRLGGPAVYYETVTDAATGRLLGAHIVSPYAGEQINLFTLAIREGLSAARLREIPWAYPTYTSDVKYMV